MSKYRTNLFFSLSIAILFVLLMNSLYFFLPYEHLNPYEYFQGTELSHFQILNIIIGGAAIPLVAIIAGSLIKSLPAEKTGTMLGSLVVILIIGAAMAVLLFGYDMLPAVALVTIIGCLFLKANRWVTLVSFLVLMFLHILVNGFGEILFMGNNPGDTIYTNIQEMNEFSSVYRNTDYFAVVGMNIEVFLRFTLSNIYAVILSVLPFTLLGISMVQFNVMKYIKENPGMISFLVIMILGGGFTIKILQVVSLGSESAFIISEVIGGTLLAAGFYLVLLLLSEYLPQAVTNVCASVGRRGLSVYVLSSIIMALVSYGIGMNLYGDAPISVVVGLTLVIYGITAVIGWCLQRFNVKSLEEIAIIHRRK